MRYGVDEYADIAELRGSLGSHGSTGCIAIHQKQYILKFLKRFGIEDAYPVSTPADVNTKLVKSDGGVSKEVDSSEYQSLVGSLLYAAIAMRPDIAHAVGAVSKFCSNPSKSMQPRGYSDISKVHLSQLLCRGGSRVLRGGVLRVM